MDKDDLIKCLRSTLLSCKGSLTVQQCERDFKQLQGFSIPYKELGFKTPQSLFETVPGFTVRKGPGGELLIDAIPSQAASNMSKLIAKQKTTAKKPPPPRNGAKQPVRRVNSYSWKPDLSSKMWTSPQKIRPGYSKPLPKNQGGAAAAPKPQIRQPDFSNKSAPSNTSNPVIKKTIVNNYISGNVDNSSAEMDAQKYSLIMQTRRMNSAASRMERLQLERDAELKKTEERSRQLLNLTVDPQLKENKTRLLKHCELGGIPEPTFILNEIHSKKGRGPILFNCTVKIKIDEEQKTFGTYPDSLSTSELAVETASSKALQHLHGLAKEKIEKKISAPDIALQRIIKIVREHKNGMINTTLPSKYQADYGENLPDNWKAIVKSSPFIKLEDAADKMSTLLYYDDPEKIDSRPSLSPSSSASSITYEDQNLPPPLQYPEDSQWNVFVVSANSTIEVWLKLIGDNYSAVFESMNIDMELHFADKHSPSISVKSGGWYALKYENEWLRVRVLNINNDCQTAQCFLIDSGDEEWHPLGSLYDLPSQFLTVAPQAILCRLAGLESFSAISTQIHLIDLLVGKVLIAVVQSPDEILPGNDPTITVVLYDTSTEEDVNLNKLLIQQLIQDAESPTLALGVITSIHVCEVDAHGIIYAQIHDETWEMLQKMLQHVVNGPFPKESLQTGSFIIDPNAYYLAKTDFGDWRRAILKSGITTLPNGRSAVLAYFIDFGITDYVSSRDVFLLEKLSAAINSFPIQVVKLSLYNIPSLQKGQVGHLKELLPPNSTVLCKKMLENSNSVEIYVRTQPHDLLCSVNNALAIEMELSKKTLKPFPPANDPVSALIKKKERIYSTAATSIPKFKTPEKNSSFDVFVSLAANPSNFTVQSVEDQAALNRMMTQLQYVSSLPSLTTRPIVGNAYAAFHEKDNCWYRVCVQGVLSDEMASIYFYDYGELQMVDISKLKELPAEFRKLPAQAIKAKLYGISPINSDWSVEDCFRFQEMVVEKNFLSVVKAIEQDPIQTNELLLTLDLVDKTSNGRISINDLLIKEGRAKLR